MLFGELLQELRKDRRLTQAQLAGVLHLSPLTISSYECGRTMPDDATKIQIARYFGVSLDYLMGLVREQNQYYTGHLPLSLPADFTPEDLDKVQEYIDFLEYKKKKK